MHKNRTLCHCWNQFAFNLPQKQAYLIDFTANSPPEYLI